MLQRISGISLRLIVIISLCLKLAFFFSISPWHTNVEQERDAGSDPWGYEQLAENLLKYHSYGLPADTFHLATYSDYRLSGSLCLRPDSYRMPLYSTFMAAIYFIGGIKPYLVILAQILLSLFSVILVYRISSLLFKEPSISKIATLLFATDIHSAFVANQLLTDTVFVLLFLLAVYFFLDGFINNKIRSIILSSLFMGLSVLTRGMVLFFPVIFIALLLFFSRQNFSWKTRATLYYAVVFIALASIWPMRNELKYGHFQYSTQDGQELLFYNAALTETHYHKKENLDSLRLAYQKAADSLGFRNEKDIFKQSDIYVKLGTDYIKKHKADYIKTHLLGCLNLYFSIGNVGMARMMGWDNVKREEKFAEIKTSRILSNFSNIWETLLGLIILLEFGVQYIGAVIGTFLLWKKRQYVYILFFLFTAMYITGLAGVVGTYRYKLMVTPFICITAAYGYVRLSQKGKEKATHIEA